MKLYIFIVTYIIEYLGLIYIMFTLPEAKR